jgi:hypothetical protein
MKRALRIVPKDPHAPKTSWWTRAAQPEDRSAFIAAAHERDIQREHNSNVILARQTARFSTFRNPIPLTDQQKRAKR